MRIGWVDYSEEERRRANQVLELAKSREAIDELGLGVIRDAFGYRFFPGSSTLHTHARYYFLTAYLMKDLARDLQGAGRDKVEDEYIAREKAVGKALAAWYKSQGLEPIGVIGINSLSRDSWVKQKPSSMNWAAMREYGLINNADITLNSYLNLIALPAAKREKADVEGDIEEHYLTQAQAMWNVPAEGYKGWADEDVISMDLLPCEAMQLRDAILRESPNSLYAAFLLHPEGFSTTSEFWSFVELVDSLPALFPDYPDLPAAELGADFSALAALLHIRFNFILRHHNTDIPDAETEEAWEREYAFGSLYRMRAERCNIDAVFSTLNIAANSRNLQTRVFLKNVQQAIIDGDVEELDELVIKRERLLKGSSRSKILNADAYRNEWYGGTELTYRLHIAKTIAREIIEALGGRA